MLLFLFFWAVLTWNRDEGWEEELPQDADLMVCTDLIDQDSRRTACGKTTQPKRKKNRDHVNIHAIWIIFLDFCRTFVPYISVYFIFFRMGWLHRRPGQSQTCVLNGSVAHAKVLEVLSANPEDKAQRRHNVHSSLHWLTWWTQLWDRKMSWFRCYDLDEGSKVESHWRCWIWDVKCF